MPTIQELCKNLQRHELELKGYKRNKDEKNKKSLALKAINSFDNDNDKDLNEVNAKIKGK